jgi:hypothetical protein
VILGRRYGINGVAMGTAIPLFCTSVFFLPIHLCRLLDLRLRDFVVNSFLFPFLLTVPVAIVVRVLDTRLYGRSLRELAVILAAAGVLYGLEFLAYVRFVELRKTPAGIVGVWVRPGN